MHMHRESHRTKFSIDRLYRSVMIHGGVTGIRAAVEFVNLVTSQTYVVY
jgi:hypothetical protein